MYAWGDSADRSEGIPFSCCWGIDAPWAHPAWSQYVIMLYDLTTKSIQAPIIHMPGATHEFLIYAMDPKFPPLIRDVSIVKQKPIHPLLPANYGYQFKASCDLVALNRIEKIARAIAEQKLSPDTSWRQSWDAMWTDAFPLISHGPRTTVQ